MYRLKLACIESLRLDATPSLLAIALLTVALIAGCRTGPDCGARCNTLVIAATGEPSLLLPPLVSETVGRDISDLVFEHLADLPSGGSPSDPSAYRPGLAVAWTQPDSSSWRFSLRPGAHWQDGQPVSSYDVRFSIAAFRDSTLGAPAGLALADVDSVAIDGDSAVVVRFRHPRPDAFYDLVWNVRIIPRHVWQALATKDWAVDTAIARLVGSGPFKVTSWTPGQSLSLERVLTHQDDPSEIRRVIWRFAGDQDAALNLLLSHEADLIEAAPGPDTRRRVAGDSSLVLVPYPSAVYGFAGLMIRTPNGRPHPLLANRALRQALTEAVDRSALIHTVIGPDAVVPPGPMSRALWIWDDAIHTLPYDTAAAKRTLDSLGWAPGRDGIRRRRGRALSLGILVPATSAARRNLAQGIQEMWRRVGVEATITAVDFPVFQERLTRGRYDVMIGAWLDEPSPKSLADQWGRSGWGVLNYGRYTNPTVDSLMDLASSTVDRARAKDLWRAVMDSLNADAPALFLYTPTNTAIAARRIAGLTIDPFSWLATLPSWRLVNR